MQYVPIPSSYKYQCSNNSDHLFEKPTGDFWCPLCDISSRPMLIPFIEQVETKETTKILDDIAANQTFKELRADFQDVFDKPPNTKQENIYEFKPEFDAKQELDVIKLGNQIWMSKNLFVKEFRNGDILTEAKSPKEWIRLCKAKQPAWCYPGYHPYYSDKQGKFYNLYAVTDPRGLAPLGFHIPTDLEWESANEIFNYLPRGGYVDFNGGNGLIGIVSYFWSSQQFITYPKSFRFLGSLFGYKHSGFSVRCLKD